MKPAAILFALESAEGALPLIGDAERPDAERLLTIAHDHWRSRLPDPGTWPRELNGLVERLARRSAQAMPLAALGRALLADLRGQDAQRDALLNEFRSKLTQLGL